MKAPLRPDPEAFARDVLPALIAFLVISLSAFGLVVIAWNQPFDAIATPWGASPNRPPYSASASQE